jgi:drug/metabolite transporter (DMT)-like permease
MYNNPVILYSLIIAFLWSLQSIAQKHALNTMSHPTVFSIFSVLYFVLVLVYIGYNKDLIHKDVKNLTSPLILLMMAGVIITFLANLLYYKILKHNGVSIVSALTSTVPLFVALMAFLSLKETLSPKQIAGIAAVVGGVFLIS